MRATGETFELAVFSSEGEPVPAVELSETMVLDNVEQMPAFQHKGEAATGRVTLPVPDAPFAVSLPLFVEGFGYVWVYADNRGLGYQPREVAGKTLSFPLEAAASRLAAVAAAEERFRAIGTRASSEYVGRMAKSRNLLADAQRSKGDEAACARLGMSSLAESLHAGEMLVVEHARSRIAASPKRKGFRFGCNGFAYPAQGEPYAELFGGLLNYATLPFYRAMTEREEGKRDFSRAEKILEWTTRDGIAVKGHPLVWFHRAGIPDWLAGHSYQQVAATHRDYVLDAVGRFRDRIHIWDVINEAHDWANDFDYTPEQLVEMTRLACDVTREADPQAIRIVNSCCTWSEYVARGQSYSRPIPGPGRTVLQYVRDVISAGVSFEVIGVQMYYPAHDLFEIDRQLDRFCQLGKPVHITELGVSSSVEPSERDPITDVHWRRFWHGRPWSESEQADWIEAYYTMCYSKPEIEAITWWDFSDPAFIPHGGLVDENLRPKDGFRRLKKLIETWG
jgi:GH35 family endo-1,4-beta-xylanase